MDQIVMVDRKTIKRFTRSKTNQITNQIRKMYEIALILQSLLKTEFKEIKGIVILKFNNKVATYGRTWRGPKGHPVIEVDPDIWIKWPTKSSWIASYTEFFRHELLHILLNFVKDKDPKFIKEAKKRDILRADNMTDFLIELFKKVGLALSPQEEKELIKILSE